MLMEKKTLSRELSNVQRSGCNNSLTSQNIELQNDKKV